MQAAKLQNTKQIQEALHQNAALEANVTAQLSQLLASTEPINTSLDRLSGLTPLIGILQDEARILRTHVSHTATTADRVGSRVKALDEEMRRVREAAERVAHVMELKSSLRSLQVAIEAQEWESTALYCSRAMAVPSHISYGRFAEKAVPTSDSPLPPAQTLQQARERLLTIFRHHFEAASTSRDSAATSRFFKLFPAIGWENEGLEAYSNFVVDLVRARAPNSVKTSSPAYYVAAVTSLFESIALIVDQHQPIVEKYYGQGKMIPVVRQLMEECDRVVNITVSGWEEERQVQRKLTEVQAARVAAQKGAHLDEETVDSKEIERLLSEIAGLAGRWGLFGRFIIERLRPDEPSESQSVDGTEQEEPDADEGAQGQQVPSDYVATSILDGTSSSQVFKKILKEYYLPLEVWHLRTSIRKAHQLSKVDSGVAPPTTTTPDDVFFILQNVLTRLISTASFDSVKMAVEPIRNVMEKDYAAIIRRKLDDVYRGSAHGSGQRNEKNERESFIILLNDLDTSASHTSRLISDISSSPTIPQTYPSTVVPALTSTLSTLLNLIPTFKGLLTTSLDQLFNQLLRPRLRQLLAETYHNITYVLDEGAYEGAESADLIKKRFVRGWENLMSGYKEWFTEDNYREFWSLCVEMVVKHWEKLLHGMRFSELGAVRLDRDLRAVIGYLSNQTVFGNAREKFQRLQQISTLVNLDPDEDVEDFYSGSGIAWKLTVNEAKNVAALRQ